MTTTEKRPGAFARAEAGSRQFVLQVGLGVVALVVGSVTLVGLSNRLADRVDPIETEWLAWTLGWVLQRLWLFVILPLMAWAVGRFSAIPPGRFALTAGLAGETFSLLVLTAMDGLEVLAGSVPDAIARIVTLLLGLGLVRGAGSLGRARAAEDDVRAKAEAEARKAEYAEFLAKAEGGPPQEPPAASPPA